MSTADLWVDPSRYSGEVCITGTRLPARVVAGYCIAFGVDGVRDNWDYLTDRQILVACWWTITREWERRGDRRTKIGRWARDAFSVLCTTTDELPDWPPIVPGFWVGQQ